MSRTPSPTPTAGQAVCELRAVTTALRLGGLDALRRAQITTTEDGAVLRLAAGTAVKENDRGE